MMMAQTAAAADAEERRLDALARCNILDTPPDPAFDQITALVQTVLGVAISTVTLVDRDRQWFKSRRGLAVDETPRDISFCTFTIRSSAPLVIPDSHLDRRFATNPLVTGAPFIRAYAGIPLICPEGHGLGSLCAIHTAPRRFPASEIALLQGYAQDVVALLAARREPGSRPGRSDRA